MQTAKMAVAILVAAALLAAGGWYWQEQRRWRAWEDFSRAFIQPDGRVIDRTAALRSTSEGQVYSLFFALVANDQPAFERILRWTVENLCAGDARNNLPAWLWGQRDDGSWGVKDANPASDADLWLAYSLLEAARLWNRPDHAALALAVLEQVRQREVVELPGAGKVLLPGVIGFQLEGGYTRLNPSYLPEFQLRYLAGLDPDGPWQAIWSAHLGQMQALLTRGLAPDWYQLDPAGRPVRDAVSGGRGSYDAIRVYLWAGISADAMPGGGAPLLRLLAPFAQLTTERGAPPEFVDPDSGAASGGAPIGFSAAVLPFLARLDEDSFAMQRQRLKISRREGEAGNLGKPPHYYDQVLALFGEGWSERRYRIDSQGRVQPRWSKTCCD